MKAMMILLTIWSVLSCSIVIVPIVLEPNSLLSVIIVLIDAGSMLVVLVMLMEQSVWRTYLLDLNNRILKNSDATMDLLKKAKAVYLIWTQDHDLTKLVKELDTLLIEENET